MPGLWAKAIVDILLVVADVDAEAVYVPALVAAGYVVRVREPGHRLLRTPSLDVHVHVRPSGHPEVDDQLAFRDRLRSDAGDRALYLATKRRLAQRDWPTMNDYADAKTAVITEILQRARSQQHDGGAAEAVV